MVLTYQFYWKYVMVTFIPSYGPKFSYLHAVFGKIWQIRMLTPPPPRIGAPLLRGILDPPLPTNSIVSHSGSVHTWRQQHILIMSSAYIFYVIRNVHGYQCYFQTWRQKNYAVNTSLLPSANGPLLVTVHAYNLPAFLLHHTKGDDHDDEDGDGRHGDGDVKRVVWSERLRFSLD